MTQQIQYKVNQELGTRPNQLSKKQTKSQKLHEPTTSRKSTTIEPIYLQNQIYRNKAQSHETHNCCLDEDLKVTAEDCIVNYPPNSNQSEDETLSSTAKLLLEKSQQILNDTPNFPLYRYDLSEPDESICSDPIQSDGDNVNFNDTTTKYFHYSKHELGHEYEIKGSATKAIEKGNIDLIWSNLVGTLNSYNTNASDKIKGTHKGLTNDEWENELARSILKLYANKITSDFVESNSKLAKHSVTPLCTIKQKPEPLELTHGRNTRKRSNKMKHYVTPPTPPNMIWFGKKRIFDWHWVEIEVHIPSYFKSYLTMTASELIKSKNLHNLIITIEEILTHMNPDDSHISRLLWFRLISACGFLAERSADMKRNPLALGILETGFRLSQTQNENLSNTDHKRLQAIIHNSYSYYFMKRVKFNAARQHNLRAKNLYKFIEDWTNFAVSEIHSAFILSRLNRINDVYKSLNNVLSLVRSGKLSMEHKENQRGEHILILALTYHNIAVQQLIRGKIREACICSQHGRRLIKLCLNYGNVFVNNFEATHRLCLDRLMKLMGNRKYSTKFYRIDDIFEHLIQDFYE